MHDWPSWAIPSLVVVLIALPIWKYGGRLLMLEAARDQQRREIDEHGAKLNSLDSRMDTQDRTLNRVETKLDMLLEGFRDLFHASPKPP